MNSLAHPINYGIYRNLYDNAVKPQQANWSYMVSLLSEHLMSQQKNDAPLIGFQSWKSLEEITDEEDVVIDKHDELCVRRVQQNITEMSCLAIDFDKNWSIEQALDLYKDEEFVLYTSYSHQSEGVDRFRMIFPLAVPLPIQKMRSPGELTINETTVYPFLHALFENTGDTSWTDLGRVVFVPSAPPWRYNLARFYHNKGYFLDYRDMDQSYGTIKPKRKPTRREEIRRRQTHAGRRNVQWQSFNLERACEAAGIVVKQRGKWTDIECPWKHLHSNHTEANHSSITYNGEKWIFKCMHETHGRKTAYDLKQWLLQTIAKGNWSAMVQFCDE